MISIEDIKKIRNIEFNKFEQYIPKETSGYPDYKTINESYYLYHPGDDGKIREIPYGSLSHGYTNKWPDLHFEELLITSPYMTGSDYSGTTVELSNYQIFKELYGSLNGVYDVTGGYSTFSVAISVKWLLNPDNDEKAQEILDTLKGLSNHPLIDEGHLSELESNLEYEYITMDWSTFELPRMIKEKLGLIADDIKPDSAYGLYRDLSELSNSYPNFETNGWPYIDDDRLKEHLTIDLLKKNNIPFEVDQP